MHTLQVLYIVRREREREGEEKLGKLRRKKEGMSSSLAEATPDSLNTSSKRKSLNRSGSVDHLDVRRGSSLPHTLEQYANSNFRPVTNLTTTGRSLRRTFSGHIHRQNQSKNHLWKFTLDPIKSPLLKASCELSESMQHRACHCFKYIMKYMGDYPIRRGLHSKTSLTDEIFQPPLQNTCLHDEIYCQIIKQVTQNRKRSSEERGWELLWLITGLFPPMDPLLIDEVDLFIKSHKEHHSLAGDVENRLATITQLASCRVCPPHVFEIDVLQKKVPKILQKIIIPDDSCQVIAIDSFMTYHQVCMEVASLLDLQTVEGFGLVITIDNDEVMSVEDKDSFFLDFLHESTRHIDSNDLLKDTDSFYQVIFLKTHFVNMTVDQDIQADTQIHYYQEVTKYLCGHYKVSLEDAFQIGSYIYRAKFGPEPFHMDSIKDMILELVPPQICMENHSIDWNSSILERFNGHSIVSSDEAKSCVLRYLSRWSTFGSHFFQVTQLHKSAGVLKWTLAINQGHLLIINSNKEVIDIHLLSSIVSWSYCERTNLLRLWFNNGSNLSFETPLYYEISQLLVYYSNYARDNKDKIHTKHRISIMCDSIA